METESMKYNKPIKIIFSCLFAFITLALTTSCGNSTNLVKHDDMSNDTGAIVYSAGWGGSTVSFSLSADIANQTTGSHSAVEISAMIQSAMNVWNNAIGKTVLVLSLAPSSVIQNTNYGNGLSGCTGITQSLFFPLCSTVNGIYKDQALQSDWGNTSLTQSQWQSGWVHNTQKDPNIIATTIWQANGNTLTSADIRLNLDNFMLGDTTVDGNYYENNTTKTIVDLKSLLIHEMGHVLGLGHVPDETNSVMYPYLNIGPDSSNKNYSSSITTVKTELSSLDISRIKSIYNP